MALLVLLHPNSPNTRAGPDSQTLKANEVPPIFHSLAAERHVLLYPAEGLCDTSGGASTVSQRLAQKSRKPMPELKTDARIAT